MASDRPDEPYETGSVETIHQPGLVEDVMKLLCNGHTVVLRASGLGSVFAVAVGPKCSVHQELTDVIDTALGWDGEPNVDRDYGDCLPGVCETDDLEVSRVLYRLTEKALTGRIVIWSHDEFRDRDPNTPD